MKFQTLYPLIERLLILDTAMTPGDCAQHLVGKEGQ